MAVVHVLLAIEVPEEFDAEAVADIPADVASSYEGPGRPRVLSAVALPELDAAMATREVWLTTHAPDTAKRAAADAWHAAATELANAGMAPLKMAAHLGRGRGWRG